MPRCVDTERFALRDKDAEYVYDPSQITAARGRCFRDVRKRVRRFERAYAFRFRALTVWDVPDCFALLKHWRRRQGRRHPFLLDWGYTRAALDQFHFWSEDVLWGWCVEVAGRIEAFALAGDMHPNLAHFFVAKTNPDLPDLSYFLRWRVYGELSAYRRVNDAGDLGFYWVCVSSSRNFDQWISGEFFQQNRCEVYYEQAANRCYFGSVDLWMRDHIALFL